MPPIVPSLWFDTQALEAAEFYCSAFPNSEVQRVSRYGESGPGEPGTVVAVEFALDGQRVVAINGGPAFTFSEAVSLIVDCADQAEVDYFWERLTDGGEEGQCGWLKDRYGFSWQVVPRQLTELLADPDPGRAKRATEAMLGQRKIVLADIIAAADAA